MEDADGGARPHCGKWASVGTDVQRDDRAPQEGQTNEWMGSVCLICQRLLRKMGLLKIRAFLPSSQQHGS